MGLKVLEKIGFFRYKSKILPTNMTNFFLEKNNPVFFFRKVEKKNIADFTHSLLSPEDPAKRIFSREKKNTTPFGYVCVCVGGIARYTIFAFRMTYSALCCDSYI